MTSAFPFLERYYNVQILGYSPGTPYIEFRVNYNGTWYYTRLKCENIVQ